MTNKINCKIKLLMMIKGEYDLAKINFKISDLKHEVRTQSHSMRKRNLITTIKIQL